jgi:hypothetical protein
VAARTWGAVTAGSELLGYICSLSCQRYILSIMFHAFFVHCLTKHFLTLIDCPMRRNGLPLIISILSPLHC